MGILRRVIAIITMVCAQLVTAGGGTLQWQFIDTVRPFALEAAKASGISADFMISQAALETGWGRFVRRDITTGRLSNNYFNIKKKATDDCDFVTILTHEYLTKSQMHYMQSIRKKVIIETVTRHGYYCSVLDTFRAYPSPRESFLDYANYLSHSPRYAKAMMVCGSVPKFAHALQDAGYATNPRYADLIIGIWETNLKK